MHAIYRSSIRQADLCLIYAPSSVPCNPMQCHAMPSHMQRYAPIGDISGVHAQTKAIKDQRQTARG